MIERPKRAVTRFFIPLIDVLILLFCIFLLMPFMNTPEAAESANKKEAKDLTPDEMRKELATLRVDLDHVRNELKKLQDEKQNPSEKLSVFVLDIDPKNGNLFYYKDGKHVEIASQRMAQDVIDEHKRRTGPGKEPFFVILFPRVDSGIYPSLPQLKQYEHWFRDVRFRFDSPTGLPPGLEGKR